MYSPRAILQIYTLAKAAMPDVQNGGIAARKVGYHGSRNVNRELGAPNNYSMGGPGQPPADRDGNPDAASAIDLTPKTQATQQLITRRLMAALKSDDVRAEPVREFFGSLDSKTVTGWSRWLGKVVSSDDSHTWHIHLSIYRRYADDMDLMLGVAELVCGVPLSETRTKVGGWKPATAPDPLPEETPVPPVLNYVTNGLPLTATTPNQFTVAATLDAPGAGNWQGCLTDVTTGDRFIAEARKNTTGGEDCLFYRFNMAGKYVDSMTTKAGPAVRIHPTGWGVDNSSDIYVTWNEAAPGRNNLVKFPFRSGATVQKKDTLAVAPSLPGNLQIALSPTRSHAVIRRVREDADEFTRYRLADLMADKPVALGVTVSVPRHTDRVMQGFTLDEETLWCLTGYTHTTKVLERYDLATGQPVANYDITHLKGEPEGLDCRPGLILIGMKHGTGTARRLTLHQITL